MSLFSIAFPPPAAGAEELPQAASPVTIAADAAMATTCLKIFLITQPPK
jgi:hypothetical protein